MSDDTRAYFDAFLPDPTVAQGYLIIAVGLEG
jgi:hypothetical protein